MDRDKPPQRGKDIKDCTNDFVPRLLMDPSHGPPVDWQNKIDFGKKVHVGNSPSDPTAHRNGVKQHHDAKNPVEVNVIHSWNTTPAGMNSLYQYCQFKDVSQLYNFVDNVVSQMFQPLFKTMHKRLVKEVVFAAMDSSPAAESCENNRPAEVEFIELQKKCYAETKTLNLETKVAAQLTADCINKYHRSEIYKSISKASNPRKTGEIDMDATMLCAAIQLLKFAPERWEPDPNFKYGRGLYRCRFPFIKSIPSETREIGSEFAIEDLNRALLLIFLAWYRRGVPGRDIVVTRKAVQASKEPFLGYIDPANPSPATIVLPNVEGDNTANCITQQAVAQPRAKMDQGTMTDDPDEPTQSGPPNVETYWHNRHVGLEPGLFRGVAYADHVDVTEYLARLGTLLSMAKEEGICRVMAINATLYSVNIIVETQETCTDMSRLLREYRLAPVPAP